ncbi:MAG: trigger factor [Oscillospiraceae bacterium]|nr:trigger factor [Oscillospiraceae bacterium]
MSVKSCEKLEKSMVELTVEVNAADFETAVEKAYKKQRGKIRMPGFRPGKAPRKMIERAYGEGVFYEEAVNSSWWDVYSEAVKEQDLKVVGYPKVEVLEVSKEGYSFKATVAVYPEVKLGQYKGLEAPKSEVNVTDEDVQKQLEDMADRNSRLVDQDREVQDGDIANIDFKGYLNNEPFDGGEATNHDLGIGSGQFVPGFEEQLIGMKAGEEKDIDITFPEDYHADLAGKAVVFHVKVNAVKVKEVPELDDDFAMDVSEFDTLDELRADVRRKMTEQREDAVNREFENVLMDKVAEGLEADIPVDMIEDQAHAFVENFARQVQAQGMSLEQYLQMTNSNPDLLLEQAKEPAERQVRLDLAVAAIIKEENIEATDEDVENEYKRQAEQAGMDVETLKKYMEEPYIREQYLRNQAIKVVVDSAVAVKPELTEAAEPVTEEAAEPAEEEAPKKKRVRKTTKKKTEEAAEPVETPAEEPD